MKLNITKAEAVEILERIALLLELRDENIFKIRAFENGARVLEGASQDLSELIETGELEKLKGIGKGSIHKILSDLYRTGRSPDFEDLKKGFPETLFELFNVPGLGAKRISLLYKKLGIKSLKSLEDACQKSRLQELEGFGAKIQEKILKEVRRLKDSEGEFLLAFGVEESRRLVEYLKKQPGLQKIEVAGSIRRAKEIVKDIDVLVTAKNPAAIHKAFVAYTAVQGIVAHGETKSSVRLKSGINCDLRTVTEIEFPYALYYFTGSKEHNVAVRTIAKKKNIKVNEYGLFKGTSEKRIPCKDEAEIFKAVGLHYIPPEARENAGEIEIAAKGPFPELVTEKDLCGVFHVHSDYSDGVAKLEQMVAAAEKMGYEYVGISDHSQSAKYAGGLEPARLKKQWKEIESLQKKFKIRIFKGIESDILKDGSLDYPDSILSEFDFVIGSLHSSFNLPEKEMTERVARAMENKYLTFVGHPTGRLLLKRPGVALNIGKMLELAKKTGAVIEINADPHRLDLDWRHILSAKRAGISFCINPDAHSVEGMHNTRFGVGIARKGWLQKPDVVNTMPLAQIEKFLRKRK